MVESQVKVSVIVPCRNEVAYISDFINSVLAQNFDSSFEIIIADGMSDDGTRGILEQWTTNDARVRLIDNPQQTAPYALNCAIRAAQGEIILRMDVHAEYAPDYIKQCVSVLEQTGADNVGGPCQAIGKGYLQEAIALAFQSPFSSGGARFHSLNYEGEVDTVAFGCWKKSTLENIGLFDPELVRNQDDELNLRLTRVGGKLWQSSAIKSCYYPRSSIIALFNQYTQYGYWKVRVIQKHRLPASVRHLVPIAFLISLIILAILSPFSRLALWLFAGLIALYVLINSVATFLTCRQTSMLKYMPVLPLIFATYHFGYGYGFLRGIINFVFLKKSGEEFYFTKITRDMK